MADCMASLTSSVWKTTSPLMLWAARSTIRMSVAHCVSLLAGVNDGHEGGLGDAQIFLEEVDAVQLTID